MSRCRVSIFIALSVSLVVPSLHAQVAAPIELPETLDRILREYEQAWRAGDADALAALFTEDGFVRRERRWIQGRDSIRAAYENAGGPLNLRAVSYAVDKSVGYIIGEYGYGSAEEIVYRGKFILALRRGPDGEWRIAADLDN